jgi:hypothetical protein
MRAPGDLSRVLHISRSIWRGKEQEPKTGNAVRIVDIPEVLARELRGYVSAARGYMFATAEGRPAAAKCSPSAASNAPGGLPCFSEIPANLAQRYWHSARPRTLLDGTRGRRSRGPLSKLKDDVSFRKEWAERVGLGFQLVHIGPQNEAKIETKKVA